jgi:hypothetical protein
MHARTDTWPFLLPAPSLPRQTRWASLTAACTVRSFAARAWAAAAETLPTASTSLPKRRVDVAACSSFLAPAPAPADQDLDLDLDLDLARALALGTCPGRRPVACRGH